MADTNIEVKKAAVPAPARQPTPEPWQSFRSEMDNLFDRFSSSFGLPSLHRMFGMEPRLMEPRLTTSFTFSTPVVDVTEDDTAYKIAAELPGIDEKDIDVSITGDTLVLKGEKSQRKEEKEQNYYLSERSYGSFQRSFALPRDVERDKIAAEFSKGVLTLTLPKSAEAQKQNKKIEIKAA